MIATLNTLASSWWSWMGAMLWQVTLLILIVTALDFVLRRWAWPQVRYALWLLILIKLIIPPTWTLPSSLISKWRPLAQVRIEQRLDTRQQIPAYDEPLKRPPSIPDSMTASLSPERSAEGPGQAQQAAAAALPSGPKLGWKALAMLTWILGMGVFILLLAHRIARLRHWHRLQVEKKTIPVWYYELLVKTTKRLQLGRLPAIVFSKDAKAPAVYGMFRPVLLLPASYLDSLSPEDAEHVLLHELAHLKRGDLWLHGLCLLLQIVYWFNPLLIWARRQMKHVREICCDLTIANVLKEKTMKYRDTLLNTARELLTETAEPGMGLLGVFEDPFRLVARLRWLERKTWKNRKLMAAAVVLVTVVMTAAVLPMGGAGQEPGAAAAKQQAEMKEMELERIENLRLDVEIKTTPPLYAAVLPRIGGLDEGDEALSRLKKLLNEAGIKPVGAPFGRYISDSDDVPLEEYVWEIGYPIPRGTRVEPPLQIVQVSEQQVASATIEDIKFTDEVWPKFVRAVQAHGLIPVGPPVSEVWKGESEGKKYWQKTEMQILAFDPDKGYPGMEISFKDTEPFTALVLPMSGPYAQLDEATKLLKKYVSDKKIETTGPPFGMYFTDGSKVLPSQYKWEIGFPVGEGIQADPPFVIRKIDGTEVASTTLVGPPEPDYPWGPFIMQLLIDGHIPSLPAIEVWHGDPKKKGAEGPRIELQIPVFSFEDLGETGADIGRVIREAVGGESESGERDASTKSRTKISSPGERENLSRTSYDYAFDEKRAAPFEAVTLAVTGEPENLFIQMKKLQDWMLQSKTRPTGPAFIQQFSNVRVSNPEFPTKWRVGYPVSGGTKAPPPFQSAEFPAVDVTYVEITEGFDEDELNQQWAQWLLERRYRIAGGALVFCPDKLYKAGSQKPLWEIRAEVLRVEGELPDTEIFTQWREPLIAAVLPVKGSYGKEPGALTQLEEYLGESGITPSGKPFFRYFTDPEIIPEDELLWEVGIPVSKGTAVKAPFEIKSLPEGLEAYTEFECSKEDLLKYCYAYAVKLQCLGFFGIGYPMITVKSGEVHGNAVREVRIPVRKKQPNLNKLPVFY